jgi:GTP-binding protein
VKRIPKLVIIGRPNVGKSSLFNRFFGRRRALVHDLPGVTRDRLEEQVEWWLEARRFPITLVDTGGLGGEHFAEEIDRQVEIALGEADIALMLFDARTGLTPADEDVLQRLRRAGVTAKIPVVGVVNKVDATTHEELLADFYAAGLDPIVTVSAEHGRGIEDLKTVVRDELRRTMGDELDENAPLAENLSAPAARSEEPRTEASEELEEPAEAPEPPTPRVPRVAIVGRPNVGKSTFVNALLGEERMIASPIAGTTVDAVDSYVELDGKPFVLIDTAGIRRRSKTEKGVEVLSVIQARKALERCDVAILMLDGESGTTDQDEKIGGLIEEIGCGVILCVNKWDTQEGKKDFSREDAAGIVRKKIAFLRYAPLLFTSAKFGKGIRGLGDLIQEILEQRRVKISTKEFTDWVRREAPIHNPMNAKFYLCHQASRHPPTFVCHVNDPEKVHFSLKRHLVNAIRERWGFMGNPVRLLFVKGGGWKGGYGAK